MTEGIREFGAHDIETAMIAIKACGLFAPAEIPTLRAQLEDPVREVRAR